MTEHLGFNFTSYSLHFTDQWSSFYVSVIDLAQLNDSNVGFTKRQKDESRSQPQTENN